MRLIQLLGILLLTAATAFSQRLAGPLGAWLAKEGYLTGELAGIIVAVGVAALVIGVAAVVLGLHDVLFERCWWYRRWWDDLANLEGHWAQKTDIKDRPFSYARIYFAGSKGGRYRYEGLGFNRSGMRKAEWLSDVFARNGDGPEMVFSALSQLINPAPGFTADKLRVFGWLRSVGPSFLRGDIYDTGGRAGRPDQFRVEVQRIPAEAIRRYLDGKREPTTDDERWNVTHRFVEEQWGGIGEFPDA